MAAGHRSNPGQLGGGKSPLDLYGHLYPDDLDTVAAGMQAGAVAAAGQLRAEPEETDTEDDENDSSPAVGVGFEPTVA